MVFACRKTLFSAPSSKKSKNTMVFHSPGGAKGTCLSKGTGSALKCKIVVPSTFQVAPCWLCSRHVYSPMHFKACYMHVMWSSAAPAALPWPRSPHWEKQLQCDAATMLKCHAEMKENAARVQVKVPNCMLHAQSFLTKKINKNTKQSTQSHENRLKIKPWEPLRPPGHLYLSQVDPHLDVSGSILNPNDAQEEPQTLQHAQKRSPKGSQRVPKPFQNRSLAFFGHPLKNIL